MTNIKKRAIKQKNLSLLFSILFPTGVLLIIFGAIKGIIPMLIIGIVFAGVCFYATPLSWISYTELKSKALIGDLVLNGTKKVSLICSATGKKPKYVKDAVLALIADGTLFGYNIINDEYITKNNAEAEEFIAVKTIIECPFCGAKVQLLDGKGKCEYCGSIIGNNGSN